MAEAAAPSHLAIESTDRTRYPVPPHATLQTDCCHREFRRSDSSDPQDKQIIDDATASDT